MKSIRVAVSLAVLVTATITEAAGVDFKDPRRALGREDDIKIDAQLFQETISAGAPISVTWQIENLSTVTIAVADKVADASFDPETQTITLNIGAEIPPATLPHLVTIAPGRTHAFTSGAIPHVVVPRARTPWAVEPRFVQIRVNVLRDVKPFAALIEQQAHAAAAPPVPDAMFNTWIDSVSSVTLNTLPVRWTNQKPGAGVEADQRSAGGGGY